MSKNKGDALKKINKPTNARQVALLVLARVEQEQGFSNLVLNEILRGAQLSKADSGLATELVYGTIQRQNTLDYILKPYLAKGVEKLDSWVRCLLRMAIYQLFYLDKVPVHAAINEAVEMAKKLGHTGISGMVNGVLRNVVRNMPNGDRQVIIPNSISAAERISIEHAHPLWLVKQWMKQFGQETTLAMCKSNNLPPRASARVNRLRISREAMIHQIEQQELEVQPSILSRDGIVVRNAGHLASSDWYSAGLLTIQDESSMMVAQAVDAQPGMRVLDCCAAPGGKSTHIAEWMDNQGELIANDIHPHKSRLIANHAERLGITCLRTNTQDALQLGEQFEANSFDRILLDAPCSGLGVIRRKPEIKWHKEGQDSKSLAKLQTALLEHVSTLLKSGGTLVYSTCTVAEIENEKVVNAFLDAHKEFELDTSWLQKLSQVVQDRCVDQGMLKVLPHQFDSDGFFIARLVKK